MRRLTRLGLAPEIQAQLDDRTEQIQVHADAVAESDRLWTGRGGLFDALRTRLAEIGSGRQRCMYCEDSAGTDIDHFRPRRRYPLMTFVWPNHLLACADCNRRKSQTFPLDEDGAPVLIDPTAEDPSLHIGYSPTTGRFVELTERGSESIEVYALNRGYLVEGRADAWMALQEFMIAYANYRRRGEGPRAVEIRELIARYSFSSVFIAIVDAAERADSRAWLRPERVSAIDEWPEIREWLIT